MPIANRCVEPVRVSQVRVPEAVENEFEYIFIATLSNFIKQIACLTIKAKDIFDELTDLLTDFIDRGIRLENKIDNINLVMRNTETEKVLPLVNEKVEVYRIYVNRDDELLVHTEMPDCIREMFEKAYPPPELDKFDEFRRDDNESMKYFTDPEFFLREWLKNVRVEKKKKKEKRRRKSAKPKQNLPLLPPPSIINVAFQEHTTDEIPVNYNYGDVATYEDPATYRISNESNATITNISGKSPPIDHIDVIPPPPPPPLPPPPTSAALPFLTSSNAVKPPPSEPKVDTIQSLLRDIQRGTQLKPVTVIQEDKRKTRDFRAMIAELRPAWDNNSDSEETDED